jgi:hypothetical protein
MPKLKWKRADTEDGWDPDIWLAELGDAYHLVVYPFHPKFVEAGGLVLWPAGEDILECCECGDTTEQPPLVGQPRTQADDTDAMNAAEAMAAEWFKEQVGALL